MGGQHFQPVADAKPVALFYQDAPMVLFQHRTDEKAVLMVDPGIGGMAFELPKVKAAGLRPMAGAEEFLF